MRRLISSGCALFVVLLSAPANGAELNGCWRWLSVVDTDGVATEMQVRHVVELCIPDVQTGTIGAEWFTRDCGLSFDIPFRVDRNRLITGPSKWHGRPTTFAYSISSGGETLILDERTGEPMIFERFKRTPAN